MRYRKVREITKEEYLAALTTSPQFQAQIFVALGGDPNDHDYAYLSFLTKQLREDGVPVQTSRQRGVWLPDDYGS